jgi:hypothetical protein
VSKVYPEQREAERAAVLHEATAFNAAFGIANEGEAVCTVCGDVRPKSEFPHYATAIIKCPKCLKAEHAIASRDGRDAAFNRGAMTIAKRIEQIVDGKKPLTHAPHITEYLDELVKQMGGTPQVVARWLKQLSLAELDPKKMGSKTVMDQYQFIGKLILYSTEHRATAPDVTALSDMQLAAERQRLQFQLLLDELMDAANPEQRRVIEQTVLKIAGPTDPAEAA